LILLVDVLVPHGGDERHLVHFLGFHFLAVTVEVDKLRLVGLLDLAVVALRGSARQNDAVVLTAQVWVLERLRRAQQLLFGHRLRWLLQHQQVVDRVQVMIRKWICSRMLLLVSTRTLHVRVVRSEHRSTRKSV
jgi:hypothetical protein